MALSEVEVKERVRRFVARVRERVPVSQVYLYGSYASGQAGENSDIDLAVVSDAFGRDRYRELILLSRLRLPDSIEIEALPFSERELAELPPGSFLREVLRSGRLVYPES
jgi:predicted nucleotidyltransferase